MSPRSKQIILIVLGLTAILVVYLIGTAPLPPDIDQINSQIDSAVSAAERRSASGVMSVVSDDFHSESIGNVYQLRAILAHHLHDADSVDITVPQPEIRINGDTAETNGRVTIRTGFSGTVYDGMMTLRWKREPCQRLLVFPSTAWRIVGADTPGVNFYD